MATASTPLDDLIDAFKREVAIPGAFATAYPTMSEDDIVAALADAFAQAQLDGWFATYTLDLDTEEITPGLSLPGQALIVLYAGMRLVRTQMRNTPTSVRYKAGSVEYETSTGVTVQAQLLKDMQARRDELVAAARSGARITYVSDGYAGRLAAAHFGIFEVPCAPALTW